MESLTPEDLGWLCKPKPPYKLCFSYRLKLITHFLTDASEHVRPLASVRLMSRPGHHRHPPAAQHPLRQRRHILRTGIPQIVRAPLVAQFSRNSIFLTWQPLRIECEPQDSLVASLRLPGLLPWVGRTPEAGLVGLKRSGPVSHHRTPPSTLHSPQPLCVHCKESGFHSASKTSPP